MTTQDTSMATLEDVEKVVRGGGARVVAKPKNRNMKDLFDLDGKVIVNRSHRSSCGRYSPLLARK